MVAFQNFANFETEKATSNLKVNSFINLIL